MVAHGQPAGGRSWASVAGGGKAIGSWSYWVCSSGQCREWNWCPHWKCRSCGRVAPPWVKAAQPPAAAAGQGQAVADAEGFVVQPRGRKARRQAKRTATRAASAGAASLAGVSEASSAQPSAVERHHQEVKRIEDFLAAPGESIDEACLRSLRSALDRERRRLSAAEAAQAERRKADTPLPKALHGAGNALAKLVRQGRAKEQALLKAEEAHAAAIGEREAAIAREAACAEAVEECRAALEAHREEQRAAEARQAKEVGAAFVGTDLLGMVFGLIQQVEALPQGFAAGNGEAAFAEVAKQIAAVRRALPSAAKLHGEAADERAAESLDGRSPAKVPSDQRTRLTAQEACIGEARLGPQPAPEPGPRDYDGRGCVRADWVHNCFAGFAQAAPPVEEASLFLGIRKLFGHVRPDVLCSSALRFGFNLKLLRGLLAIFLPPRLPVDQHVGASGEMLRHLRDHHPPLNEGKSVFLASSAQVADGLAASWAAPGFEVKRGPQARKMGTDAYVTRRGVQEGGGRAVGGRSRARRLRTLGSAGASVVPSRRADPTAAMFRLRAGWRLSAGRIMHTDDGRALDMLILGPRELGLLAAAGARRASDRAEMTRLRHGAAPAMPFFSGALSARAGWSIVQCDEFGNPQAAVHGTVHLGLCPFQTAKDGEHFAVWLLSRYPGPSFNGINCACGSTVSCLKLGRRYATAANKPSAHLWSVVYASLDADSLFVNKVEAHCAEIVFREGRISEGQRLGSAYADRLAKAGAALHRASGAARREFFGAKEVVRGLSRGLAQVSFVWQGRGSKGCESPPVCDERRTAVTFAVPLEARGELAGSRPAAAGAWASAARDGGVALGALVFAVAGRALAFARRGEDGDGQEIIACTRCGAYARLGRCVTRSRGGSAAYTLEGAEVPQDARGRFLTWLGVQPIAPAGVASSASAVDAAGSGAGSVAGEGSRKAWLDAYSLDEESLPSWSEEELLAADPSALARGRQLRLRGTVLSRRVLARSLAFCTLGRLEAHAEPGCSWTEGPPPRQSLLARGWVPPEPGADGGAVEGQEGAPASACATLAVCFAAALVDTSGEHAAEEEEGPEHRPEPHTEGASEGTSSGPVGALPRAQGRPARGDQGGGVLAGGPGVPQERTAGATLAPPGGRAGGRRRCYGALWRAAAARPAAGLQHMAEHHARRDAVNRAARAELRAGRRGPALCKFWTAGASGSRGDASSRWSSGREHVWARSEDHRSSQTAVAAGCQEGDACCFRHHFLDSAEAAQAQRRQAARAESQAAAAAELGAYEGEGDLPHAGVKVDKRRRAWSFASWLLRQYGKDALCQGGGVLDVAGGQGDLSWVLSVESGVPCTLVDPGLRRGGALKSWQRRALRKSGGDGFAHVPVEFGAQNFGPSRGVLKRSPPTSARRTRRSCVRPRWWSACTPTRPPRPSWTCPWPACGGLQ
ncbi:unnamed protein product [Prorocentrum cordatum]|uniref:Uncharacterized protein n=1 Tax=Prorocentrum cordatum TaxID=2364126 RepID=A0ABN9PYK0_9DINO|nr:unnamed protein product [Polarella glacialis]